MLTVCGTWEPSCRLFGGTSKPLVGLRSKFYLLTVPLFLVFL